MPASRLKRLAVLSVALGAGCGAAVAAPLNLIANGDFALSHRGTTLSGNQAIPDSWNGIQTQTVNAQVLNGAMYFSTAHPTTNVNLYKDYVYQSFTVTDAGLYSLRFDYKLMRAGNGKNTNGAKVYVDQYYSSAPGVTPVVVPNMVFAQTYGDELWEFRNNIGGLDAWHLGQTVNLNLTSGNHTLYLSSGTGDFINQYGAAVLFDNVSITAAAAPVPEPGTGGMLLAGLGAVAWLARGRRHLR